MKVFNALCILILFITLIGCGDSKKQASEAQPESGTEMEVVSKDAQPANAVERQKEETVKLSKGEESKKAEPKEVEKTIEVAKKEAAKDTKPKAKKAPRKKVAAKKFATIVFDSLSYDLPDITERETFERKFYFKNTSDIPLEIDKVTVTCGCTLPSYPFVPIAPDSTGYIGVFYNSVGKDGPQTPEVTVYANTKPGKTVLRMNFNVLPPKPEEKLDTLKAVKGE